MSNRTVGEVATIIMDTLRSDFAEVAKAVLSECGVDLSNSPKAAVDSAVNKMLNDDYFIRFNFISTWDNTQIDLLERRGITFSEMRKHGFDRLNVGAIVSAVQAHRRHATPT